jgi:hypothetical protein
MALNLTVIGIVVMGLTQFVKEKLGLEGSRAEALSFLIGLVLGCLFQLTQVTTYDLAGILSVVVVGLLMGLVPSGIYKFAVTNFSNKE